ncbi:MAG: hypothetical protein J5661_07580 [Bacteroidaceae bacterium]|nr:hypothetical protein [Bacteroidaceae bacterium]
MSRNSLLRLVNAVLAFLLVMLGLESCHRKTYNIEEGKTNTIRPIDGRERAMYGTSPVRYRQSIQPEAERIMEEVIK